MFGAIGGAISSATSISTNRDDDYIKSKEIIKKRCTERPTPPPKQPRTWQGPGPKYSSSLSDLEWKSKCIHGDVVDSVFLIKKSLDGERFISNGCPIHTYKPMVVEQVKNTPYWKIGCYFEGCKYDTDVIPYRFNSEREAIIAWNLHLLRNVDYLPKDFRKLIKVLKYFYGKQIEKIFSSDDRIYYDSVLIDKIKRYCNEIQNTVIKLMLLNANDRLVLTCPKCGREPVIYENNSIISCCDLNIKYSILKYATLAWNVFIYNNI